MITLRCWTRERTRRRAAALNSGRGVTWRVWRKDEAVVRRGVRKGGHFGVKLKAVVDGLALGEEVEAVVEGVLEAGFLEGEGGEVEGLQGLGLEFGAGGGVGEVDYLARCEEKGFELGCVLRKAREAKLDGVSPDKCVEAPV